MSPARKSPGTPINLPFELTYPRTEYDSHGRGFYRNILEVKIVDWLEKSNIRYNYSDIGTTPMLWFETEEDSVRFILKWI